MKANKTSETILYAVRVGAEDWEEEIITTNPDAIEAATDWAKRNGFDRFRLATYTLGEIPNFTATLAS